MTDAPKARAVHELSWMNPTAPYMPVACVGLLSVLSAVDPSAKMFWSQSGSAAMPPTLKLETSEALEGLAKAITAHPWPNPQAIWNGEPGQAIKPMLKESDDPIAAWWLLGGFDSDDAASTPGPDLQVATNQAYIRSLLTDAVVDNDGLPSRSRLLRGVKADVSGVRSRLKNTKNYAPDVLLAELSHGPQYIKGSSGMGLGLDPALHTFGGLTGPKPSAVGSFSPLLYLLCWHGIMAMAPMGVVDRQSVIVGGPLVSRPDTLSWPVWSIRLSLRPLIRLFGIAAIHDEDLGQEGRSGRSERGDERFEAHQKQVARRNLRSRGIEAVYRSKARSISSNLDVFGWGTRVL